MLLLTQEFFFERVSPSDRRSSRENTVPGGNTLARWTCADVLPKHLVVQITTFQT